MVRGCPINLTKNQTLIIFEVYFDSTERSEGEGDQKLTNQFSYVERATQTMNNTLKVDHYLNGGNADFQSLIFCDYFIPLRLF